MSNVLTTILGDKEEWMAMEARENALLQDYRIVHSGRYLDKWRASLNRDIAQKHAE
jgi:hypothetical protein